MNSLALCSLLLTLCFFLIAHSPSLTNARVLDDDSDLIGQLCNENPEKKIECMNVLGAEPKVLSAKNFFELAEAILELGLNKGIKGEEFLKRLLTTKYVPAIDNCEKHYESTVESFRNSLIKLKDDPRIANYLAAIAGDGPKLCQADLSAAHIVNHRREISDFDHQTDFLSYLAFFATGRLF